MPNSFSCLICAFSLLIFALLPPSRAASAELCTATPRSGWISWMEVEARLLEAGLRLVQLRINDFRCYEVVGIDRLGEQQGLRMHPVTGAILGKAWNGETTRRPPWKFGRAVE